MGCGASHAASAHQPTSSSAINDNQGSSGGAAASSSTPASLPIEPTIPAAVPALTPAPAAPATSATTDAGVQQQQQQPPAGGPAAAGAVTSSASTAGSPPVDPSYIPKASDATVTLAAEPTPVTLGAVFPKPQYRRRHALVIGINYRKQGTLELNGCDSDALSVAWLLERIYGWGMDEVTVMTDTPGASTVNPTRNNILSAIRSLTAAKPGDTFVFYYAGHGTNIKLPEGGDFYQYEPTGANQAIVPVDWITAGVITDDVLHEELLSALPEGCRIISIFDCCHSGTMLDLQYNFTCEPELKEGIASDQVDPMYDFNQWRSAFKALDPMPVKEVKADVIVLSGCYDLQTSAENKSLLEGVALTGGAFTRALRDALGVNSFDLACKYVLKETNCRMAAAGFGQRCQFSCSRPQLLEGLFSFNEDAPKAPYNLPTDLATLTEEEAAIAAALAEQRKQQAAADFLAMNLPPEAQEKARAMSTFPPLTAASSLAPPDLPAPGTYNRARYVNDRDPFAPAARTGSKMPPHRALSYMLQGAFGQNLWFSHWSTGSNSNDLSASTAVLNSGAITTATSRTTAAMTTSATSDDRVQKLIAYYDNYRIRGLSLGYAGNKWVTLADTSSPGLSTAQYSFEDGEVLTQLDWITTDVGMARSSDALFQSCYVLGPYGMGPWGSASSYYIPSASWIWCCANAQNGTNAETKPTFLTTLVNDTAAAYPVTMDIMVDNSAEVYVNSVLVGTPGGGWDNPNYPRVVFALQPGLNTIAIYCVNAGIGPAGLCAAVVRQSDFKVLAKTDASWKFSLAAKADALATVQRDGWWTNAFVLGNYGCLPWGLNTNATFPVPSAQWLWCTPTAAIEAPLDPKPTFFTGVVNDGSQPLQATLHVMVDDYAEILLNGSLLTTIAGGYGAGAPFQVSLALLPGVNTLSFYCVAKGGPAGLIGAVIDATGRVLAKTDGKWRFTVSTRDNAQAKIAAADPGALGVSSPDTLATAPGVYSSKTQSFFQSSYVLGGYGMGPWGTGSNFAVPSASWVWCAAGANNSASVEVKPTFVANVVNDAATAQAATLHIMVDDTSEVYLNNVLVGSTAGGWNTTAYPRLNLTLQPGVNSIALYCVNGGGYAAGLCAAVVRNSDGKVLAKSDASWRFTLAAKAEALAVIQRDGWWTSACVLGQYGMVPWGPNIPNAAFDTSFPAASAWWLWCTPDAAADASMDAKPTFFTAVVNDGSTNLQATLHLIVDNTADVLLNGAVVASNLGGGWGAGAPSRVNLTLLPGVNVLSLFCTNLGGPAGVVAGLIDANGRLLAETDASWRCTVSTRDNAQSLISAHFLPAASVLSGWGMGPWGGPANYPGAGAQWIWCTGNAAIDAPDTTQGNGIPTVFKSFYNGTGSAMACTLHVIVDNQAEVFVNGVSVATVQGGWWLPQYPQVAVTMQPGMNVISMYCSNWGGPAGLVAVMTRNSDGSVILRTDSSWRVVMEDRDTAQAEVTRLFDRWSPATDGWCRGACVLGDYKMAPWNATGFEAKAGSWIWSDAGAAKDARTDVRPTFFNTYNNTTGQATAATLYVMVDNAADVYVNERFMATAGGWSSSGSSCRLPVTLLPGRNVISMYCYNAGGPAGLLAAVVRNSDNAPLLVTDASWRFTVSNRANTQSVISRMSARLTAAGNDSSYQAACVLGSFGCGPWGSTANFINKGSTPAKWIWSTPDACINAATNIRPTFFKTYNNATGEEIPATIHAIVDDGCEVYVNGVFCTSIGGGWTTQAYPRIPVTMPPGNNIISFVCSNAGGPAGLIAALIRNSDQSLLWQTDETWRFTVTGQDNLPDLQRSIARSQGLVFNHGAVRPYDVFFKTTKQPNGVRLCGDRCLMRANGTLLNSGPLPSTGRAVEDMRVKCYVGNGAFLMGMQACSRAVTSNSPDELLALRAITSEWFAPRFEPSMSWVLLDDMQEDGTRIKSYQCKIQSTGCLSCVYGVKPASTTNRLWFNGKPMESYTADASGVITVPGRNGSNELTITYQTLPSASANPLDALLQVPVITVTYLSATVKEYCTVAGTTAPVLSNVERPFLPNPASPGSTLYEMTPCVTFKVNPAIAVIDSLSTANKADAAAKIASAFGNGLATANNDVADMLVSMAQSMTRKEDWLYGIKRMDPIPDATSTTSVVIGIVNNAPVGRSSTTTTYTNTRDMPGGDAATAAAPSAAVAAAGAAAGVTSAPAVAVAVPPNFTGSALVSGSALAKDLIAYILLRNAGHADLLALNRLAVEASARGAFDWFNSIVDGAGSIASGVIDSVTGAISNAVNYISRGVSSLADSIASGVVTLGDLVASNIVDAFSYVLDKTSDLGKTVLNKLTAGLDPTKWTDAMQSVFKNLAKDVTSVAHAVADLGAKAGMAMAGFISSVGAQIQDHVIQPLSDGFVVCFKVLKDGLIKVVSVVMSGLSDFFDYLKWVWAQALDGLNTFIAWLTFIFDITAIRTTKDRVKEFYRASRDFTLSQFNFSVGSLLGNNINSVINDMASGNLASLVFGSAAPSSTSTNAFFRDMVTMAETPMSAATWLLEKVMVAVNSLALGDIQAMVDQLPYLPGCGDPWASMQTMFQQISTGMNMPSFLADTIGSWISAFINAAINPASIPDVLKSMVYDLVNRLGQPIGVVLSALRQINLKDLFGWVFRFMELDVIGVASSVIDAILGRMFGSLTKVIRVFFQFTVGDITMLDLLSWALAVPLTFTLKIAGGSGLWNSFVAMDQNYWTALYSQFNSSNGYTCNTTPATSVSSAATLTTRDAVDLVPPVAATAPGSGAVLSRSSMTAASTSGAKDRSLALSDWMQDDATGKIVGWFSVLADMGSGVMWPMNVQAMATNTDSFGWMGLALLGFNLASTVSADVVWQIKRGGDAPKADLMFKLMGMAIRTSGFYRHWNLPGPEATEYKRFVYVAEGILIVIGSACAYNMDGGDRNKAMPPLHLVNNILSAVNMFMLAFVYPPTKDVLMLAGAGTLAAKATLTMFRVKAIG